MTTIGLRKKEEKIKYLGAIAKEMFSEISTTSFEEAFRFGIEEALKKHQYQNWGDVVEEQPLLRKAFFDSILGGLSFHLKKTGLDENQIRLLVKKLGHKNRRYLG